MLDAFAELTKSLLIPGSFPFLLFGVSIGVVFGLAGVRWRRVSLTILVTMTAGYWIGGMPVVADTLATRFHAADSRPADAVRLQGVRAIVVLGAGKRTVSSNGSDISIPDAQTILNAIEGARLYRLLDGPVPVIASGGGGPPAGSPDYRKGDTESVMIRDILVRVGVPADRIELEST